MRSAVGGLKGAALVVLLAAGLAACAPAREDVAMVDHTAEIAEARAAAERAAQAAEQAAAAAQRAEAAAAAAQRQAEAGARMFQESVRK